MSLDEAQPRGRALRMLVIGEEHVREKVARHYRLLRERGVEAHFYVDDRSGITRASGAGEGLPIHYAPDPSAGTGALLRYWRGFARKVRELRPDVLEVYTSINPAALLPMVLYARARGLPVVVVCRGELHPAILGRMSAAWRGALAGTLRAATLVIYKEKYMPEVLARYCPRTPRLGWSNAIPVGPEPEYGRRENDVLFLNSFQPARNLPVIVRAAAAVRRAVPDARFHLVGGAGELARTSPFFAGLVRYEQEVRAVIEAEGVGDFVQIHPFTSEVEPWFRRAKVFLFPADHVFCNYALLEAMERGVPPVVSDEKDPDARRIVEHGTSGLVVPITPGAVADAVVQLLSDEPRRVALGRGARRMVQERYDLDGSLAALADAYRAVAAGRVPRAALRGRAPAPAPEPAAAGAET
ncbi:MAG TPA: glycosyltransferase family 4 protein [Longimicrobium sp.]|nr:glycosyltransferase family 4 protein [Longimicrobium sp.]